MWLTQSSETRPSDHLRDSRTFSAPREHCSKAEQLRSAHLLRLVSSGTPSPQIPQAFFSLFQCCLLREAFPGSCNLFLLLCPCLLHNIHSTSYLPGLMYPFAFSILFCRSLTRALCKGRDSVRCYVPAPRAAPTVLGP